MADRASRAPAAPAVKPAAPTPAPAVRRPAPARPSLLSVAPPAVRLGAAPTGGEPLAPGVRGPIESSLNVDMGGVRVFGDNRAQSASRDLSARAFTLGPNIFLGPGESAADLRLMAHESAHVVQQRGAPALQRWSADGGGHEREAHAAAAAVVGGQSFAVQGRTDGASVQRLGISDALDYFADKANLIPGFRMFTIILGVNPINMSPVARSAANIMRAIVEFIPGGNLITQALDNHGVFDKVGQWVEEQIKTLGMTGGAIKQALKDFIDSLSWSDIFDLGGVWNRAKRIFSEPIDRIISFAKGLLSGIITFIKDAILMPIAKLAEGTRGWDLLIAVLGKNPITGEAVARTPETLIGGFMKLIGQEEIWNNIKKANALARALAWFQGALAGLMGFVGQIPTLFVNAFRSLELMDIVLLPRAFAKVAGVFGGFIGQFLSWAGNTVWNLLQIIFEVVAPGAMPYLKKVGAAFKTILKNPIGFVLNLVKAAKLGFLNFAKNIGTHLRNSLIAWLTGSLPGVYIPKSLSFMELVKFVLSVLGLTWANIRSKLVKAVGETAVKAMETGFVIVKRLVTEGPAAAWEEIQKALSNLKEMAIGAITDFVVNTLVKKAVAKVISLLIPGGAFIQAIITIYDTILVFIDKLQQIIQVAKSFLDSLIAIANGVIAGAAQRVETTLAGLLTLALSFLAGFAGLGKIANKVMEIINKIRAPIDKALDRVVAWIVTMAKKLGRFIAQAGVPQDPNERLRLASEASVAAARRLTGRVTEALLNPVLQVIKIRYGLRELQPYVQGGTWWVRAAINPMVTKNLGIISAVAPGTPSAAPSTLPPMPLVTIEFYCNTAKYLPNVYLEQLQGQQTELNALPVTEWQQNRNRYLTAGRGSAAAQEAAREFVRQELASQGKKDAEIQYELARLAALHEPDLVAGGRISVSKLGSRFINSSIGAQWGLQSHRRVEQIQTAVNAIPAADRPNRRINVSLTMRS